MQSNTSSRVCTTNGKYVCEHLSPHTYRRTHVLSTKKTIVCLIACTFVSLCTLVTCRSTLFPNIPHLVPAPHSATPAMLAPCQTLSTPTITPELFTLENLYDTTFEQYCQLIQQMQYKDAYALLGSNLQKQLPFSKFLSNRNYIVLEKQWLLYRIAASQPMNDSKSWVVEAILKATVCPLAETVWYNWEVFLSIQAGRPEIISMTLHDIGESYLPEVSC